MLLVTKKTTDVGLSLVMMKKLQHALRLCSDEKHVSLRSHGPDAFSGARSVLRAELVVDGSSRFAAHRVETEPHALSLAPPATTLALLGSQGSPRSNTAPHCVPWHRARQGRCVAVQVSEWEGWWCV